MSNQNNNGGQFPREDEFTITQIAMMELGGVKHLLPFSVHRYRDGWFLMWASPIAWQDLGRWLIQEQDLRRFLGGDWTLGRIIRGEAVIRLGGVDGVRE